ncbi:hypothetical protein [Mycobacterium marinum]|uniref:hypothetical protein n=1 Tax=Mycobacterium marinum TaxID=1781 RepID=UPI0019248C04|nr:hypothetical protein [Mycobacterium marinum]QQW35236.1 hypothetical protein HXW97_16310 [Mycobacterium marinum]
MSLTNITPDEQAERSSYSSSPNIKGLEHAVTRIKELFGVDVTIRYLRSAITQGRLNRHYIAHHVYLSDQNLYDFIVLGTKRTSA